MLRDITQHAHRRTFGKRVHQYMDLMGRLGSSDVACQGDLQSVLYADRRG